MATTATRSAQLRHPDAFFIGGEWVEPSTGSTIDVIDSSTEEVFLRVAEAQEEDVKRAISAARRAFDEGPWPRMSPQERAPFLEKIAAAWSERANALADSWTA